MYDVFFSQMKKQLTQLGTWLDAADKYAQSEGFDANELLALRLAPDQFPFVRQVQITCDTAKLAAARLTGKEAPSHPDTEASVDELRARVRSVISFLDGLTAQDFAEAPTRVITQPRWEGKVMS